MRTRLRPFFSTIAQHVNAGTVLLLSTCLALIVANSPLKDLYFSIFEKTYISIDFKIWNIEKPLYYWINDGLMAIFFFLIGLEIKRELLIGELSSVKKATVPLVAAIGGMVVPALFYVLFNHNDPETLNGWAIPMATDIAFALGILAILGKRVPIELKVLLTSLAIVDDLGAVLIIAIFYTDTIAMGHLLISIGSWLGLMIACRLGVRSLSFYIIIGVLCVWYPLLKSGVHATIAGVLVAFAIPLTRKFNASAFIEKSQNLLKDFANGSSKDSQSLLNSEQYAAVEGIHNACANVESPLQKLEHALHKVTLLGIMPLFAFANTGIDFSSIDFGIVLQNQLTYGVFTGLFLGKVIGIVGFVFIAQKLGIIALPKVLDYHYLTGAGFLAGIGFTMSIFITDLAFHGSEESNTAKISILTASLLAGVVGYLIINAKLNRSAPETSD